MHRQLLLLFTAIFLTGCSFNKMFLQPTKIPATTEKLSMKTATDTTIVHFSKEQHQPVFLKNGKDTIDLGFSIESVVFESSNGNQLNGWMLKPKNGIAKTTLVHFHGNAGCLLNQYQGLSPLIAFGFQVFIFDYSGFGFSGGKATRKNVLLDGHAALTYVKSRPDIKDTKLVIYGQSLGGHLSAVVASERQNELDALVIEGAFSAHKDIAASFAGVFGRIFVNEQYAAFKSIQTYKKPVLVIHSTEDEVIPFKLGKKIFAHANAPKEFYEIKHCHICGPDFYADSIALKINKMLPNE